jgi:hypothetical protein
MAHLKIIKRLTRLAESPSELFNPPRKAACNAGGAFSHKRRVNQKCTRECIGDFQINLQQQQTPVWNARAMSPRPSK